MTDLIVGTLALVGATLVLLAGVGVIRFGDLYQRMHAATKASTGGLALVALGCGLAVSGTAWKLALTVVAAFVTTPVAAHLIGRAAAEHPADR